MMTPPLGKVGQRLPFHLALLAIMRADLRPFMYYFLANKSLLPLVKQDKF